MQEPKEPKENGRFFQKVQAGDIALLNIIPDAISIFGYTKIGKTTSCHYLTNNVLEAIDRNKELLWDSVIKKNTSPKIGMKHNSETQIPNLFNSNVYINGEQRNITLIDQPGYGDSYGFERMFANGYFHYRTFSKTPKLRFILACEKSNLTGIAEILKKTISQFTNSFKDFRAISNEILQATSFLVTKVQHKISTENLIGIFKQLLNSDLQNMPQDEKENYRMILAHIIDNQKIFAIPCPHKASQRTQDDTTLLVEIIKKSKPWQRKMLKTYVDMSMINFSVARDVLYTIKSSTGKPFRQDFKSFMKAMKFRMEEFLTKGEQSLRHVIEQFKRDTEGQTYQHQFLELMGIFVKKYDKFNQEEVYKKGREQVEQSLFRDLQQGQTGQSRQLSRLSMSKIGRACRPSGQNQKIKEIQAQTNYFIKKVQALREISEITKKQIGLARDIECLESISQEFKRICKQFDSLRIQSEDSKIISRYCYLMTRVIEQSKIITLILFNHSDNTDAPDLITQFPEEVNFDIYVQVNDSFFSALADVLNIQEILQKFLSEYSYNPQYVTSKMLIFLLDIPNKNNESLFKITDLAIICGKKAIKAVSNDSLQEKKFIATKLYALYKEIVEIEQRISGRKADKCAECILKLGKIIGQLFESLNFDQFALEMYKSIENIDRVIKVTERMLERLATTSSFVAYQNILEETGDYVASVDRKQLALTYYQRARANAQDIDKKKRFGQKILSCRNQRSDFSEQYYTRIAEDRIFVKLANEIDAQISAEFFESKNKWL